ncbi:hypothetical protein JW879_02505 [candidate division WOR-3 bacterium]|nr:hypothetical protein [candidate division WOR-3 bacterium]
MLLTTLIPGGGQFYTERYFKGIIVGGAQSYIIYRGIQTQLRLNDLDRELNLSPIEEEEKQTLLDQRREIAWWMALVWTIGILDAYVDAQLYGFESDLTIDKTGSPKVELSLKIHY